MVSALSLYARAVTITIIYIIFLHTSVKITFMNDANLQFKWQVCYMMRCSIVGLQDSRSRDADLVVCSLPPVESVTALDVSMLT